MHLPGGFTVYVRNVPVSNDPCTFTFEKSQECGDIITLLCLNVYHSLPNPRQVSQIEDIMELGWCGKHFHLQCENIKSGYVFTDR